MIIKFCNIHIRMFINTANNNLRLFSVNYFNERGFNLIRSKRGLYERQLEINRLRILLGLIQKNSFLSSYYRLKKFSRKFWFHLLHLYQMICLFILVDTPDHQSFCSMSTHLYGRKMETFLSSNFSAFISSTSKYLEFRTFSGSTFCSEEVLLN